MRRNSTRETQCGTLLYLSPEIVQPGMKHDARVDIWAVGVLIYEFLTGQPPFMPNVIPGKTGKQLENECKQMILHISLKFPPDFPQLAKDLVKKILKKDPNQRLTLNQIINHVWLRGDKPLSTTLKKKELSGFQKEIG